MKPPKCNFLETKKIILNYAAPPCGSFGLEIEDGRIVHWDYCREQFAVRFLENTKCFYFCGKQQKMIDVIHFLHKFEIILSKSNHFEKFKFSSYAQTSYNNIIYIQPSSFWKDCYFKRSLYTLLIRCGLNYFRHNDNFDDALFGVNYKESTFLIETRIAVLRFMFGFTKYTGICPVLFNITVIKHGWKEEFYKLKEQEIKQLLVIPDGCKKTINIVGNDTLWM
jgi:hypothetical protein